MKFLVLGRDFIEDSSVLAPTRHDKMNEQQDELGRLRLLCTLGFQLGGAETRAQPHEVLPVRSDQSGELAVLMYNITFRRSNQG